VIGVAITVSSILAFAALQYVMPETFVSGFIVNHAGVAHFARRLLGTPPPALDRTLFTVLFRLFLGTAWLGYLLVLGAGLSGASLRAGRVVPVIGILALILAVACPPSLSTDSYAYVGHARLHVLHGLNPYMHSLTELGSLGDPTAQYVKVDMASVYGPIWTYFSAALVFLLRPAGLWWQVVMMKLIGAAALVGAALAGRKVADRFEPGRGELALLAIGLNPLFLIEGPGNAHNDLLMMGLLLAGAGLLLAKRELSGALLIGLSVGIKLLPIAVAPWIALDNPRALPRAQALRRSAAKVLLLLAPTVLGFVPLWQGSDTFGPVMRRLQAGSEDRRGSEAIAPPERPHPVPEVSPALVRQGPVIIVYIGLTAWLLVRRRPGSGGWLDAWVILAFSLIVWTMGVWFPWYLTWPWAVVLTRWDRTRLAASAACLGLAIAALFKYSYTW
jgi:alpha-1,6-mannosyltransferase